MSSPPIITLTTDFGGQDGYVGMLKGVILSLCPRALLVDLTHALPPQEVAAAGAVLAAAWATFPPGTIHLAVVDDGHGGSARGIAAQVRGRCYVGPDNGLLSDTLDGVATGRAGDGDEDCATVVRLAEARFWRHPVSPVFVGRDVYAPVAAHLANGTPLAAFGPPLDTVQRLPPLPYAETPAALMGAVRQVDHFGNLLTNVPLAALQRWLAGRVPQVRLGTATVTGLARSYADAAPGQLLALPDCHGWLEIAVVRGSAARTLALTRGAPVTITAAG